MFTVERGIEVMSGHDLICSFEVRYTFKIGKGAKARTWANAADGFHPAEDDTVEDLEIEARMHPSFPWGKVDGLAADILIADLPDAWLIQQAMEQADA